MQRFTLFARCGHNEQWMQQIKQKFNPNTSLIPAAVMLIFIERRQGLSLLLTKRAAHLKHHAGQISFPGGKVEKKDKDLISTAIRESHEEIGIQLKRADILGQLTPLATISGYLIYPIIGFSEPKYQVVLDKNEVDLLFELPVKALLSSQSLRKEMIQIYNRSYPIYAMQYQEHFIWGATAQILADLKTQICF